MRRLSKWILYISVLLIAGMSLSTSPVSAQLISPGKLIQSHQRVEGVSNCTSCHELGKPGIRNDRCLSCHKPLRTRIQKGTGYHATVADRNCATCHKDHIGPDFDPIRFDEGTFDHRLTGYRLAGAHTRVRCADCHTSSKIIDAEVRRFKSSAGRLAKTYLGLPTTCAPCHRSEQPHGSNFETSCESCHTESSWNELEPFDHSRTGFPIDGRHSSLTCASCHLNQAALSHTIQFTGLATACTSCHATDNVHGSQFARTDCASCHKTGGWRKALNFSHSRGVFPLRGEHRTVACESCHSNSGSVVVYRGTPFSTCETCHSNPHAPSLGEDCSSCHNENGWAQFDPEKFPADRFQHSVTGFELVGAHGRADCADCHQKPARSDSLIQISLDEETLGNTFPKPASSGCESCHRPTHDLAESETDDTKSCATCHTEGGWSPSLFGLREHNESTLFPLTGAHLATPCSSCHRGKKHASSDPVFNFDPPECETCHDTDNPHGIQFTTGDASKICMDCHDTENWQIGDRFDHRAHSGFKLSGEHAITSCTSCHTNSGENGGVIEYRILSAACASCHESDNPHEMQFQNRPCSDCHDSVAFTINNFDHSATRFPLRGAHVQVSCLSCHPTRDSGSGNPVVVFRPLRTDCASCHDNQKE